MRDWFRTPLFQDDTLSIALLAIPAVLLVCALAHWPVSSPGGVSEAERIRAGFPNRHLLPLILSPLAMVLGVFMLLWSPSCPYTLVLVTRVPSGDLQPRNDLLTDLLAEAGTIPGPDRYIDLGPMVEAACERLSQSSFREWNRDDPGHRDAIRNTVAESLRESMESAVAIGLPEQAHCRREVRGLPSWLVESVEIATLRAASYRFNARRLLAVCASRGGPSAVDWDAVAGSCRNAWLRPGAIRLTPVSIRPRVRLWGFQDLKLSPDRARLEGAALFEVRDGDPDSDAESPMELVVEGERDGRPATLATWTAMVPVRRAGLQSVELKGLRLSPDDVLVRIGTSGPDANWPASGRIASVRMSSDEPRRVRIESTEAGRWEATITTVRKHPRLGEKFKRLRFEYGRADDATGTAVLHEAGSGVWVFAGPRENRPRVGTEVVPAVEGFYRCRIAPRAFPGRLSMEGVPMRPGPVSVVVPTDAKPETRRFLKTLEPLVFRYRLARDFDSTPYPGETTVVSRGEASESSRSRTTWFGFDPVDQGCLLQADGSFPAELDVTRFEAFHAMLSESIEAARDDTAPAGSGNEPGPLSVDAPLELVGPGDLPRLTSGSLRVGLLCVLIGILINARLMIRGIRAVPGRES